MVPIHTLGQIQSSLPRTGWTIRLRMATDGSTHQTIILNLYTIRIIQIILLRQLCGIRVLHLPLMNFLTVLHGTRQKMTGLPMHLRLRIMPMLLHLLPRAVQTMHTHLRQSHRQQPTEKFLRSLLYFLMFLLHLETVTFGLLLTTQ